MKTEKIKIWDNEEYYYPMALGFEPNLRSYIHEDGEVRPCMLVVPGGGYCIVSPTEGEIVAKKFFEKGYNAFVLTYTTNILMVEPLKNQPMKDLSRAIRMIRKSAETYHIDAEKLVICGFSAGAHLCGSVCVHWQDVVEENSCYSEVSNRPSAAILSYPVITSGEKAHRDSFIALLGRDATTEELDYYSLEKQVTENMPPCFLWQTATDELVPVENSYLFADACKAKGVIFAHHVFSEGRHGLSLADEDWAMERYGEPYTMQQTFQIVQAVKDGVISMSKEAKDALIEQFDEAQANQARETVPNELPNEEVAIWPDLAETWLKRVLG